jgi:non-ribosomal peptide synthetase component E (peptide arylation enzyme)
MVGGPPFVGGDAAVSYAEPEQRIVSLAATLHSMAVRKGERVALFLSNGLDFVTAFFRLCGLDHRCPEFPISAE